MEQLRGIKRRWIYRGGQSAAFNACNESSATLAQQLLISRGMCDAEEVAKFCDPSLLHLHSPALLPNIEKAAVRIIEAVRANEKIIIYGDYDVDGVAGAAILWHMLHAILPTVDATIFIPHRIEDGYGISSESIDEFAAQNVQLIVSVDCGITATGPATLAKSHGIDLIITDHHQPPRDHPNGPTDAFAVVHPGIESSDYPWAELCGAGVAFKLAWHLATMWAGSENIGKELRDCLMSLIPLTALATIADVVPLIDENRVLTTIGLRLIKQTPIVGLRSLIQATGLMDATIDCERVGFVLGPHLNACGRMGHARDAATLLTTATHDESKRIANTLAAINKTRQETQRKIFDEAARAAEDAGMASDDKRIIVLANDNWHPGVVGIVCSKLVERFGRPAILMQRNNGICKGSARSIDGYSMAAALEAHSQLLLTHGGHAMAAGLSLKTDSLEAFTETLTAHANEHIAADRLVPATTIDFDTTLDAFQMPAVTELLKLSPFGRGNPRPAFRLHNIRIADLPRQMGQRGKHLSFRVADADHSNHSLRAVWWNAGEYFDQLKRGCDIELVVQPKLNTWQGQTNVEVEVKDLRFV